MKLWKRPLKWMTTWAGNAILAIPLTRRMLNREFVRGDDRSIFWMNRLFDNCRPGATFRWEYSFRRKTMHLPVNPKVVRSWKLALSTRAHEPHMIRYYDRFITERKDASVYFDIGANYGIHASFMLAAGFQCVLFEPQSECIEYIRAMAKINGYEPRIEQCVLSNALGEISFFVSDSTWFSSVSKEAVEANDEKAREVKVQARTLDSFTAETNIYPDLIKIDVEGHEHAVLEGALGTLRKCDPTIVVEIWPASLTRVATYELLAGEGFKCAALRDDGMVPVKNADEMLGKGTADYVFVK